MRLVTKILSCAVLVGFASSAAATPGIDVEIESIGAWITGGNGTIQLKAASPSWFSDPTVCNGAGPAQSSTAIMKTDDTDHKQVYALALAALLKDKLIDATMSNTGNSAVDCAPIAGGMFAPVIIGIIVKK